MTALDKEKILSWLEIEQSNDRNRATQNDAGGEIDLYYWHSGMAALCSELRYEIKSGKFDLKEEE
jgi:hypothetical protein